MSDLEKLQRRNRQIVAGLIALALVNVAVLVVLLITGSINSQRAIVTTPAIAGIPGLKGDKGDRGENGYTPIKNIDYFDGARGETGAQGIQGLQGPYGSQGPQGAQGEPGAQGEQGLQGTPGVPGRDREMRCNTETQMFESRLVGDEEWVPMEGSDCVAGS